MEGELNHGPIGGAPIPAAAEFPHACNADLKSRAHDICCAYQARLEAKGLPSKRIKQETMDLRRCIHRIAEMFPNGDAFTVLRTARNQLAHSGPEVELRTAARDALRYFKPIAFLDGQQPFHVVLRQLLEHSGRSQKDIAREIGMNKAVLCNWVLKKVAPTFYDKERVGMLEEIFKVPSGSLWKLVKLRVRKGRASPGRFKGVAENTPLNTRARVTRHFTGNDIRLPHDEFAKKYNAAADKCSARMHPVQRAILNSRRVIFRSDLPPHVLEQFALFRKLSSLSETDVTSQILPLRARSDGGANMEEERFRTVMQFLSDDPNGPHCQVGDMTIAVFLFPAVIQATVGAKQKRLETITGEKYLTSDDVRFFTIGEQLVESPSGLLFQQPHLASQLRPIPGYVSQQQIEAASADWAGACARAAARYGNLRLSFESRVVNVVDRQHPVNALLDHPDPLYAFEVLNERLAAAFQMFDPSCEYWLTMGTNCVLGRILSDCGFRSHTMVALDIDDLRETAEGWKVEASRFKFKNPDGPYFRLGQKRFRDFRRTLCRDNGIDDIIETYLSKIRPRLLGGFSDPVLFPTRNRQNSTHFPRFSRDSLRDRIHDMTDDYLSEDGGGIPGVMPFSTHHFRDVLCTGVLKRTDDEQQAADAICDSVDVIRQHYSRRDPKRGEARLRDTLRGRKPGNPDAE
jgi:hypothetical protein